MDKVYALVFKSLTKRRVRSAPEEETMQMQTQESQFPLHQLLLVCLCRVVHHVGKCCLLFASVIIIMIIIIIIIIIIFASCRLLLFFFLEPARYKMMGRFFEN